MTETGAKPPVQDPAATTGAGLANAAGAAGGANAASAVRGPDFVPNARIRWLRLAVIGVPIAGLLLVGWYTMTRSDMARQRAKIQTAEGVIVKYPNQPEIAFGTWRLLLEDSDSSEGARERARVAIQNLVDQHGLMNRYEDLIGELLRRGENDFVQARAHAAALLYLDREFKTGETPEAGQARVAKIEAIRTGYADATNDQTARTQYDKAIEKMSALLALYPDADFLRPVIARIHMEVADALVQMDNLEDGAVRMEKALALDPLPLYQTKLAMLKANILQLDPMPSLEKGRAAEAAGNREEAQAHYETALRNRRSNREARAGYIRMVKFYAGIFLKNAEENNGELTEEGARFAIMAEKSGKALAEYGDESLVLAKAEILLAENQFMDQEYKKAKELVDAALTSIPAAQRTTQDGSFLTAKCFKLYYHLGKIMNKLPEAQQALLLAEQYSRLAMEQNHPLAARLFVQVESLQRIEYQSDAAARNTAMTAPVDTAGQPGQVRNLVNEGPLTAGSPLDGIDPAGETRVHLPDGPPGAALPAHSTNPAPAPAGGTAPAKDAAPARDPALDRLINPLR